MQLPFYSDTWNLFSEGWSPALIIHFLIIFASWLCRFRPQRRLPLQPGEPLNEFNSSWKSYNLCWIISQNATKISFNAAALSTFLSRRNKFYKSSSQWLLSLNRDGVDRKCRSSTKILDFVVFFKVLIATQEWLRWKTAFPMFSWVHWGAPAPAIKKNIYLFAAVAMLVGSETPVNVKLHLHSRRH